MDSSIGRKSLTPNLTFAVVKSPLLPPKSTTLFFRPSRKTTSPLFIGSTPKSTSSLSRSDGKEWRQRSSEIDIDMVQSRDGVWTAKTEEKVVVLWDLDNKPPRGPPYDAAMALRRLASLFGTVVDASAYANRHAFIHVPRWVTEQRRTRRELDFLERRGVGLPSEPYVCGVCGRKCRTNLDLRKHFRQLHERERNKKIARMRSLKGKRRQKYKEKYVSGNTKYEEAAKELITPKTGYGLERDLRKAGIFVKTVADKPQAADKALKVQMQHSMSNGVDWLFLVSDDSDFSDMMWKARESDCRTVVVGDWRTSLGRQADLWVPWNRVESGVIGEEILRSLDSRRNTATAEGFNSLMAHDLLEEEDTTRNLQGVLDDILKGTNYTGLGRNRMSQFSEEEEGSVSSALDDEDLRLYGSSSPGDDFLWDSKDDLDEYS